MISYTKKGQHYDFVDAGTFIKIIGTCVYEGRKPISINGDVYITATNEKIGTIHYEVKKTTTERSVSVSSLLSDVENEFSTLLSTMASVYTQPVLLIAGGAAVPDAIEIDDTVVNATETVELDICVEHITNDIEVATYGAGLNHIGDSQNVPGVGKSMSLTISFTPTVAGEVLGAYLLIFSPADHWCHYIPITAKGVSE